MLSRLREWAQRIRSSLWFVPTVMVAGAITLAFTLIWVDSLVSREVLREFPRLFGAGAESSRSMLAAIAGSMITVAGVTFSITVVAVAQASSQYTSRVLRNFMSDRPNQVVLGVFVGVFTYCLVVLRTVRGDEEILFIPAVAVLTAFVLAIVAIGFLIYFIHHIAESLQVSDLLARVGRETTTAVDRLFPQEVGEEVEEEHSLEEIAGRHAWSPVVAERTGYIQSVNADTLLDVACEHDTLVWMERGVGEFVVEGEKIASLALQSPPDDVARKLKDAYTILPYRTVYQDVAFGVRQIVDVALKALSPSSNDSTTAVSCIDHLSAILSRLAGRRVEEGLRKAEGEVRVLARGPTFVALLDTALDEIRRNAGGNVNVLERMVSALETVASFTRAPARRAELRRHVRLIREQAQRTIPALHDQQHLERRCQALEAQLV